LCHFRQKKSKQTTKSLLITSQINVYIKSQSHRHYCFRHVIYFQYVWLIKHFLHQSINIFILLSVCYKHLWYFHKKKDYIKELSLAAVLHFIIFFKNFSFVCYDTDNKEPINYKSNKRLYQISISQTLLFQTRNLFSVCVTHHMLIFIV
jgi:hypothetical protein